MLRYPGAKVCRVGRNVLLGRVEGVGCKFRV
jgi:hypothetical protein